jgi:signal transduction histidine kinase/DNA-binding NarL/FixJ family response regulator
MKTPQTFKPVSSALSETIQRKMRTSSPTKVRSMIPDPLVAELSQETTSEFNSSIEERSMEKVIIPQDQLMQQLIQSQSESRRQEQLTRSVCHELRNPMVGVRGNTDLVDRNLKMIEKTLRERNPQDPLLTTLTESRTAVNIIAQCTDYQKAIADDVLDLARLKEHKLELHIAGFDPQQIMKDAIQILNVRAQEKKIELIRECKMKPCMVSGDATRLTQVLINLLSNAIKFTPQDGKITVTLQSPSQTAKLVQLEFVVQDTGIGMSQDQQAKIFAPFVQADAGTYAQYGGSGLGLAISKDLVALMGGDIHVTSIPGQGSTFTVRVSCGNLLQMSPSPSPTIRSIAAVGQRLLIAEDILINQQVLIRLLESAGYHCVIANNGQEAVNLWMQMEVDAILMDLMMPVMDGLAATRIIREQEQQRPGRLPVPIIGLSGDAEFSACLEAGMNDCTTKPYDKRKLLKSIAQLISPSFPTLSLDSKNKVSINSKARIKHKLSPMIETPTLPSSPSHDMDSDDDLSIVSQPVIWHEYRRRPQKQKPQGYRLFSPSTRTSRLKTTLTVQTHKNVLLNIP